MLAGFLSPFVVITLAHAREQGPRSMAEGLLVGRQAGTAMGAPKHVHVARSIPVVKSAAWKGRLWTERVCAFASQLKSVIISTLRVSVGEVCSKY